MTTNEEWLKNLPTGELAELITDSCCFICALTHPECKKTMGCRYGVYLWLKQERSE